MFNAHYIKLVFLYLTLQELQNYSCNICVDTATYEYKNMFSQALFGFLLVLTVIFYVIVI